MMKVIFLVGILLSFCLVPAFSQCPDWSYDDQNWGDLCEEYHQCSGENGGVEQSPVYIDASVDTDSPSFLNPLVIGGNDVLKATLTHAENGLVISVADSNRKPVRVAGGRIVDQVTQIDFELSWIEFHTPAEHNFSLTAKGNDGIAVSGTPVAEVQLYFVRPTIGDPRGRNVVAVSLFYRLDSKNPEKRQSDVIFDLLQRKTRVNGEKTRSVPIERVPNVGDSVEYVINLENLKNKANAFDLYYTYDGSLTSPPCDQSVEWYLVPVWFKMSASQLSQIQNFGPNAREVQPLGSRQPWAFPKN